MGKSTISMAIFNSYVTNYQRVPGSSTIVQPGQLCKFWMYRILAFGQMPEVSRLRLHRRGLWLLVIAGAIVPCGDPTVSTIPSALLPVQVQSWSWYDRVGSLRADWSAWCLCRKATIGIHTAILAILVPFDPVNAGSIQDKSDYRSISIFFEASNNVFKKCCHRS